MGDPLLSIENLSVHFNTPEGVARAVDGIDFSIARGETVGLVGESGCGKSVTSLAVMGLIPSPPGRINSGRIIFDGTNLLDLSREQMRHYRGRDMAMIFQEPMTSLNPVLPIGRQVAEPLLAHRNISRAEAMDQAARVLDLVKIPAADKRLNDYPHQLSGGMRQRVMIAMAMICQPKLLIADEPTTALDVTIQAQILSLMVGLISEMDMSLLLITHDLGVVAQSADRVVVMYAGQVVEQAAVDTIFESPFHPYTRGLLNSMPSLSATGNASERLTEIRGTVPPLTEIIPGCKFAGRCDSAFALCREARPELVTVGPDHLSRCWLGEYPENRR